MKHREQPPRVFVIAGPNGVGKTTFAREFLPHYARCPNFVNADLIASGLSPFSPESAEIHAGWLMLEQIRSHAAARHSFGFETTLADSTYVRLLSDLKSQGYSIHLFYLWVRSATVALRRIRERVRRGGHAVPPDVVRRRYRRSLSNFFQHYSPLSDSWTLFENSSRTPQLVARLIESRLHIYNPRVLAVISKGHSLP